MSIPRLHREHTAVLVIDLQEKLVPAMNSGAAVVSQCARLLDGARVLGLPVLVTRQYPKGLGPTLPEIEQRLNGAVHREDKITFTAASPAIKAVLVDRQVREVVLCGIEAHVCVLQTALDLAQCGFLVFLALDAVSSRRSADRDAAVRRMIQAGIVPTTVESALLEMVGKAGDDLFKAMLPVVKEG